MIDHYGYPTEATLERMKQLSPLTCTRDQMIDYICRNWVNGFEPKWDEEKECLQLSTGGWSGCESVIGALRKSMFWMMYWEKSIRGDRKSVV